MVTLAASCNQCGDVVTTDVDGERFTEYMEGFGLIQSIFPEKSSTDREIIMSQRTGFYVCECVWYKLKLEEEGVDVS
jgi:hypothetical protein